MKIDIKKLFQRRQHFRKGGFHANPNISWQIILGLAFLIVAGVIVCGVKIFLETNREFNAHFSDAPAEEKSIREERLRGALEIFSAREKRSVEILLSPAAVVDPSL